MVSLLEGDCVRNVKSHLSNKTSGTPESSKRCTSLSKFRPQTNPTCQLILLLLEWKRVDDIRRYLYGQHITSVVVFWRQSS